jgi:hypothetical protein
MQNQDTLESIIVELLKNVFESCVSQEDLAERLIQDGGVDFFALDTQTVLSALRGNELSIEKWNEIRWACEEVLAQYFCILRDNPIGDKFPANYNDEITTCACILALGLFAESGRQNGSYLNISLHKVLSILAAYSDNIPNMYYLDEIVERLVFFMFKR